MKNSKDVELRVLKSLKEFEFGEVKNIEELNESEIKQIIDSYKVLDLKKVKGESLYEKIGKAYIYQLCKENLKNFKNEDIEVFNIYFDLDNYSKEIQKDKRDIMSFLEKEEISLVKNMDRIEFTLWCIDNIYNNSMVFSKYIKFTGLGEHISNQCLLISNENQIAIL